MLARLLTQVKIELVSSLPMELISELGMGWAPSPRDALEQVYASGGRRVLIIPDGRFIVPTCMDLTALT